MGSGAEVTIRDLASLIARVVGYNGRLSWDETRPDGTPRKLMDNSRLAATGFVCKTPLPEGLEAMYKWYLNTDYH